jgi:hypothetical protein
MATIQPDSISVASSVTMAYGGRAASPTPPPPPPAPTITLSSDGAAVAGTAEAITVTAANLTGPLTVTMERVDGPSVSWSPATVAPAPGELVKLSMATWAAAGTAQVRGTAPGGIVSNTLTVAVSAAPAPGPTPPPPPPPPSSGAMALTLSSPTSGALPFAAGFAFRQGDIPAGQGVVVSGATAQATIRNAWPDGSAKFALIAGTYTSAGSPVTLTLSAGTASTGTALTTSDLDAAMAGNNVVIEAQGLGLASWSAGADWATPFATLVSGHRMSSWTYRKQMGSDAHLVAWLEVRLYAGGVVEVLPWIENGYLTVASAGTKTARLTFAMGGTTRYDSISDPDYTSTYSTVVAASGAVSIAAQCRAVLVSGGATSHWLGTNPQVTPAPDRAYLAETKLVPTYRPTTIDEASLAALTAQYRPMRLAHLPEGMGGGGYEAGIGLLPNQSALYLVSGDARAYRAVLAAGLSLASYSIHYRDQATNRPILFASHPDKSTNTGSDVIPTPSGSSPYAYAQSHHPAAAYLPYLLTGWNWFLEEMQFQTTLHYLASIPAARQSASYFLHPSANHFGSNNQGGPRAIAWQWRTLAMTAAVTPDADTTMRGQFVSALNYNAQAYRQIHETGTWAGGLSWAPNALGLSWEPGFPATESGFVIGAPWQDDFITMSVGFCWDLDVVTDTARKADLRWFRDFKYRAAVGRLGSQNDADEWNYRDAAPYHMYLGTPGGGGTTMAWFASWGAAYTANGPMRSGPAGANTGQTGNDLRGGNISSDGMVNSYWANIQPAIAYAVDHGALGSVDAYNRMTGASNYTTAAAAFSTTPGWGVRPRLTLPYSLPSAGQSVAIGVNNAMSVNPAAAGWTTSAWDYSNFGSYGGGVLSTTYSSLGAYVLAGMGGHNHPDNLGALVFDFTTALWSRLDNANGVALKSSTPWSWNESTESNGSPYFEVTGTQVPLPPHPYGNAVHLPTGALGGYAYVTRAAVGVGASVSAGSHVFDLATRTWSRLTSNLPARADTESDSLYDAARSRVWVVSATQQNYRNVEYLDLADMTFKLTANSPGFHPAALAGFKRSMLHDGFIIKNAGAQGLWLFDPDDSAAGWLSLTVTGTLPPVTNNRWARHSDGRWYDFTGDSASNTITRITPPANPKSGTWVVDTITVSGPALSARTQGTPHYTRLFYVPSLDCLAWIAGGTNSVTLFKPGA